MIIYNNICILYTYCSLFVVLVPLFTPSFYTSPDDRQTACRWNASTLEQQAQAIFVDCQLPLANPETKFHSKVHVSFTFPRSKTHGKKPGRVSPFSLQAKSSIKGRWSKMIHPSPKFPADPFVVAVFLRQKRTATSRADGWLVAPSGCRSWGKRWMCRIWLMVELNSMGLGYIYPHE